MSFLRARLRLCWALCSKYLNGESRLDRSASESSPGAAPSDVSDAETSARELVETSAASPAPDAGANASAEAGRATGAGDQSGREPGSPRSQDMARDARSHGRPAVVAYL
jgi:hypothetical protein